MRENVGRLIITVTARVALLLQLLALAAGCDQIAGPRDYDDCILKSMKGVNSDMAARAIIMSCQEKFPERMAEAIQLPHEVIRQLTGHAGMSDFGYFSGSIYNGNKEWTVTVVTIALVSKRKEKNVGGYVHSKEYNTSVFLAPLTTGTFSFRVDGPKQKYSWSIVDARGRK